MKEIQVGLIGLGTVGTGVAKLLLEKGESLKHLIGGSLRLKKIADVDLERDRGLSLPPGVLVNQADQILDDPDIDIVIELIGGLEPARSFILKALDRGKHVITANKALLAHKGQELFVKAAEKKLDIGFEASVCGGIPAILTFQQGLVANEIESILGIFNGTSNFILSRMTEDRLPYSEALKEAQKLGYAEADPTLDVEGMDTAHKLSILMHLAYGTPLDPDALFVEGITRIGSVDITFADELGYCLKLLAICRKEGTSLEARVQPTMIPKRHMLAGVQGAYNALFIRGDAVGDILLYGQGAGMMPTGSAVVSDLVNLGRNINKGISERIPTKWSNGNVCRTLLELKPFAEVVTHYYLRFSALDQPNVLATIAGILGNHGISIASVIQKGRRRGGAVPIVMMTHEAKESAMQMAIQEIDRLPVIADRTMIIRVEN
ncbi:MAG TPA: homoserine dehydrogenase [Thermodesulfobacteriota bacterium]|nr:homoserine dehydrogenase [Thermodesulfobacteriota bacterium]